MKLRLTSVGQCLLILGLMTMETRLVKSSDPSPLDAVSTYDWDLAISHGNGAVLFTLPSEKTLEFTFPMPRATEAFRNNRSEDAIKVVSLDSDLTNNSKVINYSYPLTYQQLEKEWGHMEVKALASDPSRNLLYFSHVMRSSMQLINLGVFNFTSRETILLLQTTNGSIEDLTLYQNDVYFVSTGRQAIMKLETAGENFTGENFLLPVVVKQFYGGTAVTGFAFRFDRTLYYSTQNPSTISYIRKNEDERTLISSNIYRAHALQIFNGELYFMNTPHFGTRRTIERVGSTSATRETLIGFEGRNQIPTTFTIICGILYWNDAASQSVWKMPMPMYGSKPSATPNYTNIYTSTKMNRHYSVLFPYSVISRQFLLDQPMCRSKGISSPMVDYEEPSSKQAKIVPEKAAVAARSSALPEIKQTSTASTTVIRKVEFCGEEESEIACLNGATCLYLETNLFCLCPPGFFGPKCELDWDKGIFNSSEEKVSPGFSQSCSESNQTFLLLLTTCLSGLVVALIVILIILSFKVRRLRCNPKINRRLIVSRPDSGRLRHPNLNICEMIDIENCCDMTICETPCYDSGTGKVSLVKGSQNHEDKERLIDC